MAGISPTSTGSGQAAGGSDHSRLAAPKTLPVPRDIPPPHNRAAAAAAPQPPPTQADSAPGTPVRGGGGGGGGGSVESVAEDGAGKKGKKAGAYTRPYRQLKLSQFWSLHPQLASTSWLILSCFCRLNTQLSPQKVLTTN